MIKLSWKSIDRSMRRIGKRIVIRRKEEIGKIIRIEWNRDNRIEKKVDIKIGIGIGRIDNKS